MNLCTYVMCLYLVSTSLWISPFLAGPFLLDGAQLNRNEWVVWLCAFCSSTQYVISYAMKPARMAGMWLWCWCMLKHDGCVSGEICWWPWKGSFLLPHIEWMIERVDFCANCSGLATYWHYRVIYMLLLLMVLTREWREIKSTRVHEDMCKRYILSYYQSFVWKSIFFIL